ncbi:MAG: hypothetical protein JXB39_01805 [Deltaproteobacteria bacterium]|nr:hypothetical protein [Deltaproteobacteria bacterium]
MAIYRLLISPPVAFLILLVIGLAGTALASGLAARATSNPFGKFRSYACGEDIPKARVQPDYSMFFPFAFAFTILHVAALVVAVGPGFRGATLGLALLYLAAAGIGLSILVRRHA